MRKVELSAVTLSHSDADLCWLLPRDISVPLYRYIRWSVGDFCHFMLVQDVNKTKIHVSSYYFVLLYFQRYDEISYSPFFSAYTVEN